MAVCGVILVKGMSSSKFTRKQHRELIKSLSKFTEADVYWGNTGCRSEKGIWVDKYNIRKEITQMSFNHLVMCVFLIEKREPLEEFEVKKLEELNDEIERREKV